MRSLLPLLAICTACTAPLAAADVTIDDLRIGGGVLSNTFKGSSTETVSTAGGSTGTTSTQYNNAEDSRSNARGEIRYMGGSLGAGGGFIYGADIGFDQARFNNADGSTTEATSPLVDLHLGYGYAPIANWHFELTPFIGVGRTYYSLSGGNNSSTSHNWTKFWEYGGELSTYYTFPGGFQLGVEVPYQVARYNASFSHSNNGQNLGVSDSRRSQGFGILGFIGVRF